MDSDLHSKIELLIVDDEADFRDQAVLYFRRLGFQWSRPKTVKKH